MFPTYIQEVFHLYSDLGDCKEEYGIPQDISHDTSSVKEHRWSLWMRQ